jgi:hypothetical protein
VGDLSKNLATKWWLCLRVESLRVGGKPPSSVPRARMPTEPAIIGEVSSETNSRRDCELGMGKAWIERALLNSNFFSW